MNGKWRISIDVIAGLLALAPISSGCLCSNFGSHYKSDAKIADQSDYRGGFEK